MRRRPSPHHPPLWLCACSLANTRASHPRAPVLVCVNVLGPQSTLRGRSLGQPASGRRPPDRKGMRESVVGRSPAGKWGLRLDHPISASPGTMRKHPVVRRCTGFSRRPWALPGDERGQTRPMKTTIHKQVDHGPTEKRAHRTDCWTKGARAPAGQWHCEVLVHVHVPSTRISLGDGCDSANFVRFLGVGALVASFVPNECPVGMWGCIQKAFEKGFLEHPRSACWTAKCV